METPSEHDEGRDREVGDLRDEPSSSHEKGSHREDFREGETSSSEAKHRGTSGGAGDRFDVLRRRAEKLLEHDGDGERDDARRLVEELRVYQVELELQNNELRDARARLEASRERYRGLFDQAPIGYAVFTKDGIVKSINLTGVRHLSERNTPEPASAVRPRIEGKPFLLYLAPDYRDLFSHHLDLTLRTNTEQTTEVLMRRRDTSTFWARLQSVPFPDPDGQSVRTALIDVTAQKELERELIDAREEAVRATQVQRAFLSSMSHEIRTPLTSVIGFADVLSELSADSQHLEIARLIKGSGRRLLSTLNSVLSYARLQEQESSVRLAPTNVADLAHESVRLLQPLAETKGIALVFECDVPVVVAPLHEEHLDRVLDNLIGNALKYTEEGSVTVRVRALDETVEIDVEDTGLGIDEPMLKMIFEPFFQAGSGVQRTADGIGLGLSITKQLVDLMNGSIDVRSRPGEGTRFTLQFPRLDDEALGDVDTGFSEAPVEPSMSWRVLLVDDSDDVHQLVTLFLRHHATVHSARSAEEAIEAVRSEPFDAVFLDIDLGEKQTGMEVLHRMREMREGRDLPMVAITAYALPGDRERFERSGFNAYVRKPFTKRDLLLALRRVG